MRIDIAKLDERINKLQTIRRIASDPEMERLLLEFLASNDDTSMSAETASTSARENGSGAVQTADNGVGDPPDEDEASKLISGIMGQGDSKSAVGIGHWGKRRA
ncbi:MAG: hypothetical protein LAQ69_03040 [Acidobacteriia bacterium]|nr:hypothetical protein [Terriglobia bacterium]